MKHFISIYFIYLMVHNGFSQSYLDTVEDIYKTDKLVTLDGNLDDEVWKDLKPFHFTEYSPSWGQTDVLTSLYVTFDDNYLYVGFDAKDPNPEKIIKRTLVRDGYYGDDYSTIYIDPNQTGKNAFMFSVYPSGARLDHAIYNDNVSLGRSSDGPTYDMIWEGKSQINADGWQSEFRIPLSVLRFEIRNGQVLGGISAVRTINYDNKLLVYPKLPQEISGAIAQPSLKKPVRFIGLLPKKDLQITPYILGSNNNEYHIDPKNSTFNKVSKSKLNAGLDVRIGVTPNLTLDLTLNTDFSQVDIDNQIVNLDRSSIFLPERRKFFLQQAGLFIFNTGLQSQLFYSRTIGINNGQLTPIIGGAKLTGELGNWDVGFITLQTEGIKINQNAIDSENFSVLRLRRKVFNNRSFIGFMATNRVRNDYFNSAIGLDGVFDLGHENLLIGSISSTFEGKNYGNTSFNLLDNSRLALQFNQRKQEGWFMKGAYEYSGDLYNPAMGFVKRNKHHNIHGELENGKFNRTKVDGIFNYRKLTLVNSDVFYTPDLSKVLTWYNSTGYMGRFFTGEEVSLSGTMQYEFLEQPLKFSDDISIPKGQYFFKFLKGQFTSAKRSALKATTSIQYGEFFDGNNLEFQFSPEWNINEHVSLIGSWRLNHLNFKTRQIDEWINIPQMRIIWAYNLHLSGSITAQYNSLTNKFFTSARLRYNFKDGHDFYLAYNKGYNTIRDFSTFQLPYYNNQVIVAKYTITFMK
ncbi:hypothetical protein EC396_03080 [Lutibacter sp. HS1-25]|uniref:DUF5916 domain-containing protein n=1 Tax=Lutibacter sp. HS1-25 TaxID=2485000 RepID=UPI001012119F|nr:DUF5916 domain-containing protein [Lutibacter sp. HS1-25]RXP62715.1 hypothetical protein EC396_03080 [Lutibacter sp. HS1-25]